MLSATSLAYYDDKGEEKGRVAVADILEMSVSNKKKHCLKFTCKVVDAHGVQHKNRTYECQVRLVVWLCCPSVWLCRREPVVVWLCCLEPLVLRLLRRAFRCLAERERGVRVFVGWG